MTLSVVRVAAVWVACLLITSSIGFGVYQYLETEYQKEAEAGIRLELKALQDDIRLELSGFSNALTFLIDQAEIHLQTRDAESLNRLAFDFLSLVRTSHLFYQIRLIDMSGQEIIRANYNDGESVLVPAEELQNKAGRYYFKEGLKLGRGEVYVSPFDLNVEHGKIEEPFKPVIRLVQPAYGADGKQGGMVVVNILGTPLLKYFEVRSRRFPVQYVALLNRDGYWLQGPVAKDLWGFMFPDRKGRSMAATKPELWQQIHDLAQVRARANGGVYLSDTFYPARLFGRRGLNVERSDERFWKLVAYYPDRYVKEALTDQYRLIALSSFGTGVALAIILLAMLRLRRQLELQRVSEERMRQQAMESERSKAVVTIAGGVAHEFNNILAGMLGSTYLLRSKLKGQPELGDSIDTIERLGRRAGDLVQRLMTYAQVDFREHKRLFLNDLVAEKMEEIRQGLAPDISLHVSIDDEPLPLKGDRSKLEKMLEHLISNAVDAVEKTGAPEIRVTLGPEGIDDKPASVGGNRYACLTIADNGSGIAKDILPLIFDPFFTTKEPGKGVGMGLALVHGVVQALQGEIRVEKNEGGGSVIRIYLRLDDDSSE